MNTHIRLQNISPSNLYIACLGIVASFAVVLAPIYSLIVLFGCCIAVVAFVRPTFGIFLLLVTTPTINIINIPILNVGGQTAPFTINDLLLPWIALAWIARKLKDGDVLLDDTAKWAGIFILIDIASLAVNITSLAPKELMIAFLYLARWTEYALLYLIVRDNFKEENRIKVLVYALMGYALLVAVLGFIQLIVFPNMAQAAALGNGEISSLQNIDLHRSRMASVFVSPNHLAAYFLIYIAVSLSFLSFTQNRKARVIWLLLSLTLLAALAFTQSRAGFLGILPIGWMLTKGSSRKPMLIVLATVLLAVALSPGISKKIKNTVQSDSPGAARVMIAGIELRMDMSSYGRLLDWQESIRTLAANPILGCGYNAYKYAAARANNRQTTNSRGEAGASNSFLTILATTGIVGLFVYVRLLYGMLRRFLYLGRSRKGTLAGILGFGMAAAIVGSAVHALSIESLLHPQVMFSMWMLAGATTAASKLPDVPIQEE